MLSMRRCWSFFLAAIILAAVVSVVPLARADVFQSTPSMPPQGAYKGSDFCVQVGPGVCVVNPTLFGFTNVGRDINESGEAIDAMVTLSSDIYTESDGHAGTFLGHLSLFGPIGILYSGRNSDDALGTFPSMLTEFDLTGMFNGHSIEVMLTSRPSLGMTTIASVDGADGQEFRISSFFDVFAEISIDHGQFMPGPERHFVLTPEPGSLSLMMLGLAGAAGALRRKGSSLLDR